MFKYSNNIKFKNKPKKESLDELDKRGITVYDNKGNAVNSASSGSSLTDVIKKTVTKAKSTVNNTLNGATVRYTGSYCLPVPVIRINQGFYGKYSHAGSKKINYTDGSGNYGAIDFKADKDTPAYAVLP